MTHKKKSSAQYSSLTGIHRAVPIILFAVAVFTMFCYITQDIGALGHAISALFLGLFSYGAYSIPLLLALHAIFYPADISEKRVLSRVIFSVVAITFISALAYSITYWNDELVFSASSFYKNGQASVGGGFIGSVVGFSIIKVFGRVGLIVIAAAILAIYISYFFARGQRGVSKVFFNLFKFLIMFLAFIERLIKGLFRKMRNAKSEKVKRHADQKNMELTDDEFFAVDNGMQRLSVSELGIKEIRSDADSDGKTTLHEKVFHKSAVSKEEAEEMEMREKAEELFYATLVDDEEPEEEIVTPQRRRIVNVSYDDPDSKIGRSQPKAEPVVSSFAPNPEPVRVDDSADAIFTQSFDPFSMVMSEELASKPSSRSLLDEMPKQTKIREEVSELTEEELEREKRILEFERRKASIVNSRRAIPVDNDGEFKGTPKNVDFRERQDESASTRPVETASSSFVFDKKERAYEAPKAEPANYTSIGFGEESGSFSTVFTKTEFTTPETIYSYDPEPKESVYTPTSSYKAPVNESVPYSTPFVEEEETKIFERKTNESYSTYTPASDPTPTVYERAETIFERKTEKEPVYTVKDAYEEKPEFSYTATKTFDEPDAEEYVPEFKPYRPVGEEEPFETVNVITIEEKKPEEASTLKVEREYVVDEPEEDLYDDYDEPAEEEEDYSDTDFGDTPPVEEEPYETEEIPPEEQNPVVQSYKDMFSVLRDSEPEEEPEEEEAEELTSPDEVEEYEQYEEEEDDIDAPPFEHTYVKPEPKAERKEEKKEEKAEKKKPDFSNYKAPSLDLLGLDPVVDDDRSEINENTKILIDTLASFNVTASIKGVDRGPRITRYEVVPARGVKVNSITNLFNDIALNLAKEGIRMEAPIPGKSAIGFEIPNKRPQNVRLRELLECEEFDSAKSKTYVGIGKDVAGNPVFGDISKYPHALICGATGMGKSVCINSIMISMLYKARPDEVKFIMIDPKKVEFRMYSGIPHLLIPVITEAKQAAGALMWAVEEMERRYELIEKNNVRNIEAYNEKVLFDTSLGEPLPKIVIVIDELADLMMQVRDPVEDLIMRIAQKARAAGIHLIIGTQRPSVQVITGAIKANIPSRISCKVTSQVDSRTIFDMAGAEKLLNRGDMLYWPVDKTKALRVQGAFVSDKEVEDIMEYLKSQVSESAYDDEVFAEINKAAQKCGNNKKSGVSADDIEDDGEECGYYSDQQFLDAVELAIRSKKVSTSLLQRKLSIGYGKAAKYIDAMQDIGIVSEPKGQKPRDVLLSLDEWHEKLSRVDF